MTKAAIASIVVGTIVLIIGIVLGWAVFPKLVKDEIGEKVELKQGTDQYERFKKLPLPFDFKVYLFHIKNRDKANEGEKPIVEEKGPYIYTQTREKKNITREGKDEISYYEYQHYEFNKEASGDLDDTDTITLLNPALNSAIQILEKSLPFTLPFFDDITDVVFNANDIYLDTTVKEFLFDGYKICDLTKINALPSGPRKLNALIVCTGLYLMPNRNIRATGNELVFTFLNHKQNNHDGHFTINNGIRDKQELAVIQKWENEKYLKFWTGANSTCNRVHGRDAVIFPPFIEQDTVLSVFNTDICRVVDLHFNEELEYRDVTAYEFVLGENTLSESDEDQENYCYCLKATKGITQNNGCLKKGAMELFTCYNAPIVLSFPHFLWAHDDYKSSVEGLSPDEKKHKTYAYIEPNTGSPLTGSKRVQFNMFVRNVDQVKYLEKYKPTLIPILWLDEHVDISDDLYDELYESFVKKMIMITGISWGIVAVGIFVIVVTLGVTIWRSRSAKQTV